MPKPKDPTTTVISVALPVALKERIQAAASEAGLTQTQWINFTLAAALPGASADSSLVDEIKVVDERSRGVFKDVVARLDRIEKHLGLKVPS